MTNTMDAENPVASEVRREYRSQLRMSHGSTHYENCWHDHWACVLEKLLVEIDRLQSSATASAERVAELEASLESAEEERKESYDEGYNAGYDDGANDAIENR